MDLLPLNTWHVLAGFSHLWQQRLVLSLVLWLTLTQTLNVEVSYTSREACGDVVQHTNHFPVPNREANLQLARANPSQAAGRTGDWLVGPRVQAHKAVGAE